MQSIKKISIVLPVFILMMFWNGISQATTYNFYFAPETSSTKADSPAFPPQIPQQNITPTNNLDVTKEHESRLSFELSPRVFIPVGVGATGAFRYGFSTFFKTFLEGTILTRDYLDG
ncbi:MAG TPA: hypothetical protein VJL87_00760, partial [Bdellovibrionota bacterium]|nr:hypothetical protein [Bdellovibrionota bacterium]